MALLEEVILSAEEAQRRIQDDGRITGPLDRIAIRQRMLHIRALTIEIDQLLNPFPRKDP